MTEELQARLRAALAITPEKLDALVSRLVRAGDPSRIIVFGSRARGDASPDSDLDVAVIADDGERAAKMGSWLLEDLHLKLDLLVTTCAHFDTYRHYVSSVHHDIDCEGLVLYDRTRDQAANGDIVAQIVGRRDRSEPARHAA